MDAGRAARAEPADRGHARLRRRLRVHTDVGTARDARACGCGGGERRDERDVRRAPRRRVPLRRRAAEVRRRRAPPLLRRRGPRSTRRDGRVPDARAPEADRSSRDDRRTGRASHARRHPQRALRVLPRRLLTPRARRRGPGRDAHRRDGGLGRRGRDPPERRGGGARLPPSPRRRPARRRSPAPRRPQGVAARGAAAGGEPARPRAARAADGAGRGDVGHRRGRAPQRLRRVRPLRRHRRSARRGHGGRVRGRRAGHPSRPGRGRPLPGVLPRDRHRCRRRQDRPRRRRSRGVRERRGADASHASRRLRRLPTAAAPRGGQPRARVRRRGRGPVPADVHDPRRNGGARGAPHGACPSFSGPRDLGRPRAIPDGVHRRGVAGVRAEGQVRGGRTVRRGRGGGDAGRPGPACAARRANARARIARGRARAGPHGVRDARRARGRRRDREVAAARGAPGARGGDDGLARGVRAIRVRNALLRFPRAPARGRRCPRRLACPRRPRAPPSPRRRRARARAVAPPARDSARRNRLVDP